MILELAFLVVTLGGVSVQQCYQAPVSTLLQCCGCGNLNGLTIFTRSGNVVVDDRNCGDLQQLSEFKQEPFYLFSMANKYDFYTIIVVDPNAPNLKKNEVYLHMIRTKIPGVYWSLRSARCCTNQGKVIVPYQSPAPPPGSGKHNYISLLFRNSDDYAVPESDAPQGRSNFNLGAWLKGKGLCGPVATIAFGLEKTT